jgi:carbon-monoxide dehydrogenase small subunit
VIVKFILNGRPVSIEAEADRRLVDLLRLDLGLTGTKECCGSGECGACAVLVDGESRLSCLLLAAQLEGRSVTTVEGISDDSALSVMQQAFVDFGAVQCGFCTPGMIISALDLLRRNASPTREEVREGLSGNFCRCTGYQKIVDAVMAAADTLKRGRG